MYNCIVKTRIQKYQKKLGSENKINQNPICFVHMVVQVVLVLLLS